MELMWLVRVYPSPYLVFSSSKVLFVKDYLLGKGLRLVDPFEITEPKVSWYQIFLQMMAKGTNQMELIRDMELPDYAYIVRLSGYMVWNNYSLYDIRTTSTLYLNENGRLREHRGFIEYEEVELPLSDGSEEAEASKRRKRRKKEEEEKVVILKAKVGADIVEVIRATKEKISDVL